MLAIITMNEVPREIIIFLVALVFGAALGLVTALLGSTDKPGLPVRIYLLLLTLRQPKVLKTYAKNRTSFSFREKILAGSFIWFFIFLILGMVIFGCGRYGCS
jgi:hypothetical protein